MVKNIKINKKKLILLGSIVLVNTFIVGTFSLGGHVPGKLDDTKVYKIIEEDKIGDNVLETSFYSNTKNHKDYAIHYGKPYLYGDKILRKVTTYYENNGNITEKEERIVPCERIDSEAYVETITYRKDYDDYLIMKQSINDEIMDDAVLLGLLTFATAIVHTVGKSIIDREEEKKLIKE